MTKIKDKTAEQYERWIKPLLEGKIYVPYSEKIEIPSKTGKPNTVIVVRYNLVEYNDPDNPLPPGHGYVAKQRAIDYNGEKTVILEYKPEKL